MAIKFEKVLVTPGMARKWLSQSGGNRILAPAHLERLTLEMKAGTWKETPEPIAFDENGDLVNGHHRMNAVIASESTIEFWVARGVPRGSVSKIDGGRSRSVSDRLYAYTDDACVKRIVRGVPSRAKVMSGILSFLLDIVVHRKVPSVEEAIRILRFYEEHIVYAMDNFSKVHKAVRRSSFTTAYVIVSRWASDQGPKMHSSLITFCDQIKTGEHLERHEPAYALREYFHSSTVRQTKHILVSRVDSSWVIFTKTLRAMQAHLHGERLTRIQPPPNPSELIEYFTGPRLLLAKKLKLLVQAEDEES